MCASLMVTLELWLMRQCFVVMVEVFFVVSEVNGPGFVADAEQ